MKNCDVSNQIVKNVDELNEQKLIVNESVA